MAFPFPGFESPAVGCEAAPPHHHDEESHVFAMLAGSNDAGLDAVVKGRRGDHVHIEALWAGLRTLAAWSRRRAEASS